MSDKEFDTMNVIPLVDVMLVLLTIVLTTSTFIATGLMPVDLPKTDKNMATKSASVAEMIEINRQGELYFRSRKISPQEMKDQIRGLQRDAPFTIRADRGAALQIFVDVLEILKKEGFSNVNLQTEESV